MVKNLPASAGDLRDVGSVPELARSPGGGHSNPLQYSCLEDPHGQRSLVGYSSWGCKGLDMTKHSIALLDYELFLLPCFAILSPYQ